jgi:hypothetical protein
MSHDPTQDHEIDDRELLARIARLPEPDFDPGVAEHIRRRARVVFLRHAERTSHPWLDRVVRWYGRVEPIMVAGVAASYLFWGFTSAMALYQ